jgi:uncharacterized sulfatase
LPPAAFQSEFLSDEGTDPSSLARYVHDNAYELMANGIPLSEEELETLYALYDATIKYVDSCVGDLITFIERNFENNVIVITADHGDLLGEQGLLGHHTVLHDAVIHTPLVVHGLPELGRHTGRPVQHIDVMQTLLRLVGGDTSQFQGVDLVKDEREVAFSQALRGTVADDASEDYARIRQYNTDFDASHLPHSLLTSARTTEFKLLYTEEWSHLYDLPDETADVSDKHSEVEPELQEVVKSWLASEAQPVTEPPEESRMSPAVEQHMRDMGYLE